MLVRVLALMAVSVLSFCNKSTDDTSEVETVTPREPRATEEEAVPEVTIPGIDTASMSAGDRRLFSRVTRELTSPCGDPTPLAECALTDTCRACKPAAAFVARVTRAGLSDNEIREYYTLRFSPEHKVELANGDAPVAGTMMGAPVTLVEFSDFECPHCQAAHPILKETLQRYSGRVKLVFHHFPLSMHERARHAARAAVAAQRQGKFWEMADKLFGNPEALADSDFERYATEIGLDVARFRTDYRSPEVEAVVAADRALGESLEIHGTPRIFVNGRGFEEPFENLAAYLDEEIAIVR